MSEVLPSSKEVLQYLIGQMVLQLEALREAGQTYGLDFYPTEQGYKYILDEDETT